MSSLGEADVRRPEGSGPLRFAFADPPYPRQSRRHYSGHADFAGEVDHEDLVARLVRDYPDGWALCSGSRWIDELVPLMPDGVRMLAWCKPMSAMKPGVSVDYCWEPVYLWGGRRRPRRAGLVRDFLVVSPEQWTFTSGAPAGSVIGQKPRAFCRWVFDCLGARPELGDEVDDLFPGSGGVGRAWGDYAAQTTLWSTPEQMELG